MDSKSIYINYFKLGYNAYREKVMYYEENPDAIASLNFDERLEMDIDYLYSLFGVGRYERFLSKVDPIIELIIEENILEYKSENIFQEILFKKSACLYQLQRFKKSDEILQQLVRMNPKNHLYLGLLTIVKRKSVDNIHKTLKAVAMSSFLIVFGITLAKIIKGPQFFSYVDFYLLLRNVLFTTGASLLIGLEIRLQYQIYKETGTISYKLFHRE